MAKPTETSELNKLHQIVAKILRTQLEETITIKDETTGEDRELSMISPALIAQAIKFLKDNDITALPEDDENIQSLKELLEEKRKLGRERLSLVQPTQAAGEDD